MLQLPNTSCRTYTQRAVLSKLVDSWEASCKLHVLCACAGLPAQWQCRHKLRVPSLRMLFVLDQRPPGQVAACCARRSRCIIRHDDDVGALRCLQRVPPTAIYPPNRPIADFCTAQISLGSCLAHSYVGQTVGCCSPWKQRSRTQRRRRWVHRLQRQWSQPWSAHHSQWWDPSGWTETLRARMPLRWRHPGN